MGDDALGYLGLDAKDFKTQAKESTQYAKYLEQEAIKLDAAIRTLDNTFRKAGKTTGAQTAQLGQMRKALKEIQSDYRTATRDAAAFSAASGNANATGASGGGGRNFLSGAAGAAAAALYGLSRAIQSIGDNASEAIDKLQAGGSRRDAASGDRGMNALGAGLSPILQDSIASFPSRMAAMASKIIGGIRGSLPFAGKEKTDAEAGLDAIAAEGEEQLKIREKIAAKEDEVASAISRKTPEMDSQLNILNQQLEVEKTKLELANHSTVEGRQQANQAKVAMGELKLQMDTLEYNRGRELKAAEATTRQMELQQRGMKNIGDMVKTEADYTAKIAQARREGNTALAGQLQSQMGMALKSQAAGEHNLSSRDILNERKSARKFERDARHQAARESDIQDRARRGAYNQTKGSRADRFGQRQIARLAAGGGDNMNVNEIKTANMTAANFTLTAL